MKKQGYGREEPPYARRGEPPYGRREAPPMGPRDNYNVGPIDFVPSERHKYVLDHLATFTVGKQDLLYPEDGMRKLRQMEMTTGVWTMQVTMQVESRDLVITDRQTEEEMERFPLSLISDPTAIVNEDRRDVYNNILLFTIMGDNYQRTPSEMHIFQCKSISAQNIVEDLRAAIHARSRSGSDGGRRRPSGPGPAPAGRMSPYGPPAEMPSQWQEYERAAERSAMATAAYMPGPSAGAAFRQSFRPPPMEEHVMTESVDRDVQLLNHCFDDIEKIVGRLQYAAEAFRELDRRREGRDRRRGMGDGMLTMRARPPPAKDFIDIFQKFKLAFNLLAKLRKHIHDPNAPELVHFLITPLSLIVEASKDPGHGTPDLASKVVSPLLTAEAKELLKNCLTSKESDLWVSLGDAWTVSRDQWKGYVPPYTPKFTDGWNPEPGWFTDSSQDVVTAAIIAHQQNRDDDDRIKFTVDDPYARRGVRTPPPVTRNEREDPYARRGVRTPPPVTRNDREDPYARRGVRTPPPASRPFDDPYAHSGMIQRPRSPPPAAVMGMRRDVDPTYAGFQKRQQPVQMEEPNRAPPGFIQDQHAFRSELLQKGEKVVEVMHEREGRNPRELSVQKGEILEVLDESRNWWKLRNSKGEIGHAPYTILSDLDGEASGHGLGLPKKGGSRYDRKPCTAVAAAVPRSKAQFSRASVPSHATVQMSREQRPHSSHQHRGDYRHN
ncbi:Epidermal growth factor receptor kinase substrate 8 [Lamellibrachia satsuma]|nr:Epidermal growth factor receptor kinase substrate 8 [Lamellibrachia satsuma]